VTPCSPAEVRRFFGSRYILVVFTMLVAWLAFQPWRWRQYFPPKRWTSTGLHSVTSQNASRSPVWELQIQHGLRAYFPRILAQPQHPPVNENQMDSWRRIIINLKLPHQIPSILSFNYRNTGDVERLEIFHLNPLCQCVLLRLRLFVYGAWSGRYVLKPGTGTTQKQMSTRYEVHNTF
jgi:hypothetical protein